MVDIQSKEVIDKISEQLKIQPSIVIPRVLGKDIQLVFDVNSEDIIDNPQALSSGSGLKSTTGTLVALTTPTGRDYFLTKIDAGYVKDVVASNATGAFTINVTIGGRSVVVGSFPVITLLAQQDHLNITLIPPIKLDRATSITMTGTFAAGVVVRTLNVAGFTRDPE